MKLVIKLRISQGELPEYEEVEIARPVQEVTPSTPPVESKPLSQFDEPKTRDQGMVIQRTTLNSMGVVLPPVEKPLPDDLASYLGFDDSDTLVGCVDIINLPENDTQPTQPMFANQELEEDHLPFVRAARNQDE